MCEGNFCNLRGALLFRRLAYQRGHLFRRFAFAQGAQHDDEAAVVVAVAARHQREQVIAALPDAKDVTTGSEEVIRAARNIPGVVTTTAKILSVYDIVNAGKFIVDKAALAVIEEVFA